MRKIPQPSSSGSHVLYSGKGNVEFKQLERKHHLLEKKTRSSRAFPCFLFSFPLFHDFELPLFAPCNVQQLGEKLILSQKKHTQKKPAHRNWKWGKEWAGLGSQQQEYNYQTHYQWLLAGEGPLTKQLLSLGRWKDGQISECLMLYLNAQT